MQLELFDTVDVGTIELEDIFSAYYECRKTNGGRLTLWLLRPTLRRI